MNLSEEYFIRELTRKLNEQINSIRRELDNLKKMGFLKTKTKNRKKYYFVNKDFIFLDELKSIIIKALSTEDSIAKDISEMGNIKIIVLAGQFVGDETTAVDMLIVGDIDKEKLATYLNNEVKTRRPVRFTILDEENYRYRISCNDKFIKEIIKNPDNKMPVKKI